MENQIKQSDNVKSEWSSVCQGCLSGDRNLTTLKMNMELFLYLAGQSQVMSDPDYNLSNTLLCWECTAVLRRIHAFQTRVRNAQYMLQGSLYQLNDLKLKSLSALTVSPTQIMNNSESMKPSATNEIETPVLCNSITTNTLKCEQVCPKYSLSDKIKKHDISIETHQEALNIEAGKLNNKIEVEVKETDIICKEEIFDVEVQISEFSDTELAVEDITDKCKVKKEQKKKSFFQKYSKKADITVNEAVHSKNFDGCHTKVCLSENEIEKMINKNNKNRKQFGYKCRQCNIGFKLPVDYKRHKTFGHKLDADVDGSYKCLECFASVATRDDLLAHWNIHNYVFKCKFCGLMFGHRFQIQKHLEVTHSKVYTCRECQAVFYSMIEFGNHHKELHPRLICDYCGKGYVLKDKLTLHIQNRHCVKCGKSFKTSKSCKRHYNRHHPGFTYSSAENLELAYCVECDKQCGSVYKYRLHLKTAKVHSNKPPKKVDRTRKRRKCPVCDKVYSDKMLMEQHYDLIHRGKSKFQCKICKKSLLTLWGLQRHTQRIHEKLPLPKTKTCDICGRAFNAEYTLINHRRTHTGERPYACLVCPAAFAQKTSLVLHMRKTHDVRDFTYKSVVTVKC